MMADTDKCVLTCFTSSSQEVAGIYESLNNVLQKVTKSGDTHVLEREDLQASLVSGKHTSIRKVLLEGHLDFMDRPLANKHIVSELDLRLQD